MTRPLIALTAFALACQPPEHEVQLDLSFDNAPDFGVVAGPGANATVTVWGYDPDIADVSADLITEESFNIDGDTSSGVIVVDDSMLTSGYEFYVTVWIDMDADGTESCGDYVDSDFLAVWEDGERFSTLTAPMVEQLCD